VLLVVLWVRSYWVSEFVRDLEETDLVGFRSDSGALTFYRAHGCLRATEEDCEWGYGSTDPSHETPRYSWSREGGSAFVTVPIAPLVIFEVCLAIAPWIRLSQRFSLRTLLTAITLLAVGLGTIIGLNR
jgi:hypothetical protein